MAACPDRSLSEAKTCADALPACVAACRTCATVPVTSCVPRAASLTLRAISCVAACCFPSAPRRNLVDVLDRRNRVLRRPLALGDVSEVQGATSQAVSTIQGIGRTILEISEIATSIASAVEEQTAATQEIARSIQQAAQGTQEVSGSIVQVRQAATNTGAAAA